MMRSLWTAASGMRAQQVNVDTIANNVANINTIGYKSQQASFKSLLYQNLQSNVVSSVGAGAGRGRSWQPCGSDYKYIYTGKPDACGESVQCSAGRGWFLPDSHGEWRIAVHKRWFV